MLDNTQKITLDIQNNQTYNQIYMKQYNKGSSIEFEITKNGEPFDLSNCEATFQMKKPDGTVIWNTCMLFNNILSIVITEQMSNIDGKATFQITLIQNDCIVTTVTGIIIIDKSVIQNDDIESSDQFNIIINILEQIETTKQLVNEAKEYTQEAAKQAILSQSYAIGNTNVRENEETDNAKYYSQKAQEIINSISHEVFSLQEPSKQKENDFWLKEY